MKLIIRNIMGNSYPGLVWRLPSQGLVSQLVRSQFTGSAQPLRESYGGLVYDFVTS
ncbi:hypothetical protein TDB9533_00404 [Thalassocella blandensis]|nr:hypothetical protein TDB9533_00404 [Thalassocella blandensis]